MEEFARVDASTTLSYLAHTILCVNSLSQNASKEQKTRYLPELISGNKIGCFCMSEPDYGSDAISMQTRAQITDGGHILNGTKMWVTNAQYADVAYVYARTGQGRYDLTTFIVEKGLNGFLVGSPIHKMGMRGSPTAEIIFDNAFVPFANRLGKGGDSIYHMMRGLEIERITLAAMSLGIARGCVEACQNYVSQRKQFGRPIGDFQLVQKMVAEMTTETDMMAAYLYHVARQFELGKTGRTDAAQVKLALPKMATKIALDAIQIHGGYGYSQEFPIERFMRDAKLLEIGGGTNEIMIKLIAKELTRKNKFTLQTESDICLKSPIPVTSNISTTPISPMLS